MIITPTPLSPWSAPSSVLVPRAWAWALVGGVGGALTALATQRALWETQAAVRHVALTSASHDVHHMTETSRRETLTLDALEANRPKLDWLQKWRCPPPHDVARCFLELVSSFCPGL